jgi:KDO2-lipid IV(A) lauroyltransferase
MGASIFEMLWLPNFTLESLREFGKVENIDLLRTLKARGKGVVVVTAHIGAWEFVQQCYTAHTGETAHVIYKRQANTRIDSIIKGWRERFGSKAVAMEQAPREIFRVLASGGFVGIVGDQSAPQESVRVSFFGREVPTFEGPAVFALRAGAPLAVGFSVRHPDGRHTVSFREIQTDDLRGASAENVKILTQRHVRATEEVIRQHPEQWMWMHKRWKHAPDRV